jgi:hypothetical protein
MLLRCGVWSSVKYERPGPIAKVLNCMSRKTSCPPVRRYNLETTENNMWELGSFMATVLKMYNDFLLDDPKTTMTSHDSKLLMAPYLASCMTFDDHDASTSSLASASCRSDWFSEFDLTQFESLQDYMSFTTCWKSSHPIIVNFYEGVINHNDAWWDNDRWIVILIHRSSMM